jgi:hypothetical protein
MGGHYCTKYRKMYRGKYIFFTGRRWLSEASGKGLGAIALFLVQR